MKTAKGFKVDIGVPWRVPRVQNPKWRRALAEEWFVRYGRRCLFCNRTMSSRADLPENSPSKATIDHIDATALGGSNELENLQVICRACNNLKSAAECEAKEKFMANIIKTDISTMPEMEWLQLRHPHLGSSEVATLLGEGYAGKTYWQVYNEKSKPFAPVEDDGAIADRLWWGKQMQRVIGEAIIRNMDWVIHDGLHHVADASKRLAATVDFTAYRGDVDGLGIVESKNRDWLFFRDRYEENKAWVYDEIQLALQMHLHPDATWGAVAVCVGGNDLKVYDYRRDELADHVKAIEDAAAKFWKRVDAKDEPPITYVDLPLWIADRAKLKDDEAALELPGVYEDGDEWKDVDTLIELYDTAKTEAGQAKKVADNAKARLVQLLGDAPWALSERHFVKQSRRYTKERVVTPDMVGNVLRKASTSTTITVGKRDAGPEREAKPTQEDFERANKAQAPIE